VEVLPPIHVIDLTTGSSTTYVGGGD